MQNIIEIENLNYLDIFKDFSLSLERNKLIFISGANNSGKTTLIKILDRQISPNATIKIAGIDMTDYKLLDYNKAVKVVIPNEIKFIHDNVDDEINYYINSLFLNKEEKNKRLKNIYKYLNLNRVKKELIKNLSAKDLVRLQLAVAIASMPKVLLIDDIGSIFTKEETLKITDYLKQLTRQYDISIISTTNRLDETVEADYLYIVENSCIVLEGEPIEVLKKDNILNRVGLRVPFMIDLSVKLKDYDLIDNIELDMNRMTEILWK